VPLDRHSRQSRLAQGRSRPTRHPKCRCKAHLPAKVLADLNPIEQVFARLKTLLRKVAARTFEAISDAIATILENYTPGQCANYLIHAGYAST
jgi:hypothetical protein